MQAEPHLVLAGGGHAHLAVLADLARSPTPKARITLVTPHPLSTYTGMVPGVIAGQYALTLAQIDVAALGKHAGAALIADRLVAIDPSRSRVRTEHYGEIAFDFLSLDIGSQPAQQDRIHGAAAVVKPIEEAVSDIEDQLARLGGQNPRFVIVGGGAGGIDLAFAIQARLARLGGGEVTIYDRSERPVAGRHRATSELVRQRLAARGIQFVGGVTVDSVEGRAVVISGRKVEADAIIWATGAAGHHLMASSDLEVDERGFLIVDDQLRCPAHPEIFAAGDCATMRAHPKLPKAGVHAVRQGPTLAANLRAALAGRPLRRHRPQREFLSILNTADGSAVLSYGPLAYYGRTAWWLKDRIDRRFVARYRR